MVPRHIECRAHILQQFPGERNRFMVLVSFLFRDDIYLPRYAALVLADVPQPFPTLFRDIRSCAASVRAVSHYNDRPRTDRARWRQRRVVCVPVGLSALLLSGTFHTSRVAEHTTSDNPRNATVVSVSNP
jgi:hypothetical protein